MLLLPSRPRRCDAAPPTIRPRRHRPLAAAALIAALATGTGLHAQTPTANQPVTGAATAEALAAEVMRRFADGSPEEFAAIFPDSLGRVFKRSPAPKRADLARVVHRDGGRAVLLLAGTTRSGNGGSQTNNARHFSGFYEAARVGDEWRVVRQIPFDTLNHIRAHRLNVDLSPGTGIEVVDTMTISVGAPHGFAFRINNQVRFESVQLNGRPVDYEFGGGIVWIDAPPSSESELVLTYSLAAASRGGADDDGPPAFGAFHNSDVWHPAFDYMSANQLARMNIVVRIPAEYRLTTTLPQTDTVRDGIRTVHGSSPHNDFLLALIFDRDWQPQTTDFGPLRFETFTTPGYRHSHDTLAARVKHLYDLLAPRFGEPRYPARYLAAVENRALGLRGGFNVAMNSAAISAGGGAGLGSEFGQIFAHEVGHAWTMNATGQGANFLREGWARYVESLVLRDLFGEEAERAYWENQRTAYMVGNDRRGWNGGFEGQQSILANFDNGRIHYTKGSLILRAANWALGDSIFDLGMRKFIAGMGLGPRGYEEFIAALSEAAGHDMTDFIMPWLRGRHIPDVEAVVQGDRLILTQRQPDEVFRLPRLEVELTTPGGRILHTVDLLQRADTFEIGSIGPVREIRVDPNHRYLMQRHWGDVVRFTLPASKLPGAREVRLIASFLRSGVTLPAVREGETFVVEVPLTAGHYTVRWTAVGEDGSALASDDPALTVTRKVEPVRRIQNAYPGR